MFKNSAGSSKRWTCGCLLSFSCSVVSKLVAGWSVAVPRGWCPVAPCYSLDGTGRLQLWKEPRLCTRSPSTSGKCSSRSQTNSEAAGHFCKRHMLFIIHSGSHVGLNSLWFYFSSFPPNSQPQKKNWCCIYNYFKSMLFSEHSPVIYHHFSAIFKECHWEIFFPLVLGYIALLFMPQLSPRTQGAPLPKLLPAAPNPGKSYVCLFTWPPIILRLKLDFSQTNHGQYFVRIISRD